MEYVIYCDESLGKGQYYSDFFGGALVKSSDFENVKAILESHKAALNLNNEIKWVMYSSLSSSRERSRFASCSGTRRSHRQI